MQTHEEATELESQQCVLTSSLRQQRAGHRRKELQPCRRILKKALDTRSSRQRAAGTETKRIMQKRNARENGHEKICVLSNRCEYQRNAHGVASRWRAAQSASFLQEHGGVVALGDLLATLVEHAERLNILSSAHQRRTQKCECFLRP